MAEYLPCKECSELMIGIKNYFAREVCAPCGGVGLVDNEEIRMKLDLPVYRISIRPEYKRTASGGPEAA